VEDHSLPEKQTRESRLNKNRPVVLKVGGSVITNKSEKLQARTEVMNRLAEETKQAAVKNLIIVHGGGSFGHPVAQEYSIKEGFKEQTQRLGFAETHHVMTVLNGLFMDALVWHGIPAVSVTPLACVITKRGRIQSFEQAPFEMLLEIGALPVMYGDATLDSETGFSILSGDQLVSYIATKYDAERIIMGVDVDGLYNSDPKLGKNAKMFTHLTSEELKALQKKLNGPSASDVTGGMFSKIVELIPAIEYGIPVTILNATKPNYVYKALKGEKVEGTLIEKE
jgi:isopentenyl phosphate kinase